MTFFYRHSDLSKVLDKVAEIYGYGHAGTRTKVYDQLCQFGNASLFYGAGADLYSVQIEHVHHEGTWGARVVPAAR